MSATGTAIADFGNAPGNTDTTVVVTGQTGIVATSKVEAWIDGTLQAGAVGHSADEHAMFSSVAGVICRDIVPGVGFTIQVAANMRVVKQFNLAWVWV